jgi:acetyltransferase-like isoleucine patch superfamily enzyme
MLFEGLEPLIPKGKLSRALGFARAAVLFRGAETGPRLCALGPIKIANEGRLIVGARVTFLGGMISSELVTHPSGVLQIGSSTSFNYGSSFEAHQWVSIGQRCLFASMVRICDRNGPRTAPVVVGDDVWVAHGAILEPGVTIGNGSVVAAGSVVTKDVPPNCLAIGNPARAMKLSTLA